MSHKRGVLLSAEHAILKNRGFKDKCLPLDDIAERIENIDHNIQGKIFIYKWSGMIVLFLVPLISTMLSVFATENLTTVWVKTLTYTLTILTLINSIFRPSLRFKDLCEMGVQIKELRSAFLAALESLSNVKESDLLAIRATYDKDLVIQEKRLIGFFLPVESQGSKKRAA
jgi:hypothetical protein